MGQLTKPFVEGIVRDCTTGRYPPLTSWELKQLALAWLQIEEGKHDKPERTTPSAQKEDSNG